MTAMLQYSALLYASSSHISSYHARIFPSSHHQIIDMKAYGGVDVRKNISHELRTLVNKTNARVVDLCCGVGMSTRALETAFHDAEFLVG